MIKKRDRQALRYLWFTIFGSIAIAALLGAGFLLLNPQILRPAAAVATLAATTSVPAKRPAVEPAIPSKRQSSNTTPTPEIAAPLPNRAPNDPPLTTNVPPLDNPTTDSVTVAQPAIPTSSPPIPEVKVSRAEIEQLIAALNATRTALGEANFAAAKSSLQTADALAKFPKHKEVVARLSMVSKLVEQFQDSVRNAVLTMQAGETLRVGTSTQVTLVEAKGDRVVLRIAGMNKTFLLSDLPPGLALALADQRLPTSDPTAKIAKGAYLLTHKRADRDTLEKATALWQEAQAAGAEMTALLPFLKDNDVDLKGDSTPE